MDAAVVLIRDPLRKKGRIHAMSTEKAGATWPSEMKGIVLFASKIRVRITIN
jgi:hypothetical protein